MVQGQTARPRPLVVGRRVKQRGGGGAGYGCHAGVAVKLCGDRRTVVEQRQLLSQTLGIARSRLPREIDEERSYPGTRGVRDLPNRAARPGLPAGLDEGAPM